MGPKSEEIFSSFKMTNEETKYKTVMDKFDGHFNPKKNIIYERAKFLRRKQGLTETAEDFVTDLYSLARTCEWGTLEDEMLLMVIIIGMRDQDLSDKLQLENKVTLESAITSLRKSEELKRQKEELTLPSIEAVNKNQRARYDNAIHSSKRENRDQGRLTYSSSNVKSYPNSCIWCGSTPSHRRGLCPAKDRKCSRCKRNGHFSHCCLQNNVREIDLDRSDDFTQIANEPDPSKKFIGCVYYSKTKNDPWTINVRLNEDTVKFKIDTGADVTVIPSNIKLSKKIAVQPTQRTLSAAGGSPLSVLGTITAKLSYKGQSCMEKMYVADKCTTPLLGKPAIEKLKIIPVIREVSKTNFNKSANDWIKNFPDLFSGLGKMKGSYKIELKNDAKPYAISVPRRIPVPLWEKTKKEIENMVNMDVITPVDHATSWCAPMVVVPKKDRTQVRICVDLTMLNKNVFRQTHSIWGIDYTMARIKDAKVFSKLDANHGFWQIALAEESQDLTTFLTPWGRYKFKVLPFGITSAPEYFQKRIQKTLGSQRNCLAHIDDILVWGSSQEEHDLILNEVLKKLRNAGITLNKDKCVFSQPEVQFLGHHLSSRGVQISHERVKAILEMKPPSDIKEVQRFLGMINFCGKYIPNRSEILKPIHDLLKEKNEWFWGEQQQHAFESIKKLLTSAPQLAFYDPRLPTLVSADASSYGLGGLLLQKHHDGKFRPVSYISRSLTEAEKSYSNIEREALAITWACDKLRDYIIGREIVIETDHKPLVKILSSKNLDDITPRLQRMRLRMMRYSYSVTYTPGKHLAPADCLSRCPIPSKETYDMEEEIEAFVQNVVENIPTTDENINRLREAQQADPIFRKIAVYCHTGWPEKSQLPSQLVPYFSVKDEISLMDNLLLRNSRIIVPSSLCQEMLHRIHVGHLGATKCREKARFSLWWPGMASDINMMVASCPTCIKHRENRNEPLIPSEFPKRPWEKAAMDLFKLNGKWFIVITDQFSRYFEIATLQSLTASEVIEKCKSTFSRHGIPEVLYSDSGTQFGITSAEFRKFAKEYNFLCKTSSPQFHQSNGSAEAAVKIA
ncbi:uncharacterized protein K02A2.6-like [Macrosteles quadrilineatus]|uniref:uncharacterized protein K02A2.6-like n=1 Tax=Macrosteles quadrilineatus TaxID=74068 RepID=UPI0023E246D4|nr:uncharacterized protein K02A2.6-like [Macrosteles quadrilineatus]